MTPERFAEITSRYSRLRIAVVGDFCLDRYLEIDPNRAEISIETGLPVYNIVKVRAQPGGAGTILNNLVALGIGELYPIGFCGQDGEGYELQQALQKMPGVELGGFLSTDSRSTFTYCKPLILEPGKPPRELNRLDTKNWTQTPESVQVELIERLTRLAPKVDGLILLDQVDVPGTGVVTDLLLKKIADLGKQFPSLWIVADSRSGLGRYPPVSFKMNREELQTMAQADSPLAMPEIKKHTMELARKNGHPVFITLSEDGMVGATPSGEFEEVPALQVRGPIDIVGAGDCVTANLTCALAAGATLRECLHLAMTASSIVVHQLGTTGVATVKQMRELIKRG